MSSTLQSSFPSLVAYVSSHRCIPADEYCRRSAEFQKHLSVNKKDFSAIEYLLRKGHRQLEMYASPGIRNIR